jgi:hypothetical protein
MASTLEQFAIAAAEASARRAKAQRHVDLGPAFHEDLTSYNGPSIAYGIVLAGGAYPLVLGLIGLVVVGVAFVWMLFTNGIVPGLFELGILPAGILLQAGIGAVIGAVWAAFVSVFTLPVVYLFVRSLKLKGSIIWLGAVSGGLVGFLAVLPLTLSLPMLTPTLDGLQVLLALLAGPGLTTILGQLGGAWGGRRAVHYAFNAEWKALIAATSQADGSTEPVHDETPEVADKEPRFQFHIRHILWIFVWLSLLLSVIRLSGIPFEYVLPLLVGWLLYQSATLYVGSRFFRWRDARAAEARQSFHVEPSAK